MSAWSSVTAAWPAWITVFEGRLSFMYLDTKLKVTTGTGNLIDSPAAAQSLLWLRDDGTMATSVEIAAEWQQIKAHTELAPKGGYSFKAVATLHLADATIDKLLQTKTAEFWTRLLQTLPELESWPADAQLALLDEAWQNGPAFLDTKKDGKYVWAGTRAAALAQDWTAAASHVPGTGRRADARRRLFTNAAAVKRLGLDPAKLWNLTPPKADPVLKIYHSARYDSDYLWFQGGWVPPKTYDILTAVQLEGWDDWGPIRLSQGGLSTGVVASALTHAGLGAFDIAIDGRSKARVWRLSSRLLRSGIIPFLRGYVADSFQRNRHIHAVRWTGAPPLHRQAYDQIHSARFGYLHGGGGLAGLPGLRYAGPSTKLEKWDTSPYRPENVRAGGTVYVVTASSLLGLNVDRGRVAERKQGYQFTAYKEIHRWGRWNALDGPVFYAIGPGLLEPVVPTPDPAPNP